MFDKNCDAVYLVHPTKRRSYGFTWKPWKQNKKRATTTNQNHCTPIQWEREKNDEVKSTTFTRMNPAQFNTGLRIYACVYSYESFEKEE